MNVDDFVPFLINDRSSAFLHLIDTCKFSESEMVDLYHGICYRLKDLIDLSDTAKTVLLAHGLKEAAPTGQAVKKPDNDYENDFD